MSSLAFASVLPAKYRLCKLLPSEATISGGSHETVKLTCGVGSANRVTITGDKYSIAPPRLVGAFNGGPIGKSVIYLKSNLISKVRVSLEDHHNWNTIKGNPIFRHRKDYTPTGAAGLAICDAGDAGACHP